MSKDITYAQWQKIGVHVRNGKKSKIVVLRNIAFRMLKFTLFIDIMLIQLT